jgi:hypothetical protein
MKNGNGNTKYADVVGDQNGVLDVHSLEQRDYRYAESRAPEDLEKMSTRVRADASEALTKYAGEVEIRRKGHARYGEKVSVERVKLVYDGRLVPLNVRGEIRKQAKIQAANISRKLGTNIRIEVIFFVIGMEDKIHG